MTTHQYKLLCIDQIIEMNLVLIDKIKITDAKAVMSWKLRHANVFTKLRQSKITETEMLL